MVRLPLSICAVAIASSAYTQPTLADNSGCSFKYGYSSPSKQGSVVVTSDGRLTVFLRLRMTLHHVQNGEQCDLHGLSVAVLLNEQATGETVEIDQTDASLLYTEIFDAGESRNIEVSFRAGLSDGSDAKGRKFDIANVTFFTADANPS